MDGMTIVALVVAYTASLYIAGVGIHGIIRERGRSRSRIERRLKDI
jgi:hypothetical protein